MGELHLEIVVDRLRREFGVKARVGKPQVAYRETVTRRAEGENKFVRVAGGPGGRAASTATSSSSWSPPTGAGATSTRIAHPQTDIPSEHAPAVEAGVAEAVERGVIAGFPMTDLRVQVVGGSYHPVDSNHYAFKVGGNQGVRGRRPHGRADRARAGHGARGRNPRGIRRRRPRRFARTTRKSRWNYRTPWCTGRRLFCPAWLRCSDMRPTCGRGAEAALPTRWNSTTTLKCRIRSAKN